MEVIIWSNKRINLIQVEHILMENPQTSLLNEFSVKINLGEQFDASFFLEFTKVMVEAGARPQCHVIILDSLIVEHTCIASPINVFTCIANQIKNYPMKFLIFYDLKTVPRLNDSSKLKDTIRTIQTLTNMSSQIIRYHHHSGQSLSFGVDLEGNLSPLSMTLLARAIIETVRSEMNLK